MSEDKVFDQEVSPEELENVTGGSTIGHWKNRYGKGNITYGCTSTQRRNIYKGGFPNCAATVEDGSYCGDNDACIMYAVVYDYMESCQKAWQ